MVVPVRTCVGCRRRDAQNNLVRLALRASEGSHDDGDAPPEVVLDVARRLPGRGAWLHLERECCESAVRRRAFNRAFRRQVDVGRLDCEAFVRIVTAEMKAGSERWIPDEHRRMSAQ